MRLPLSVLLLVAPFIAFSQKIDINNITIARDNFGVPHIFAKTDAEAAYGLAWAHAEDDFEHIQQNLLAAQGHLGEVIGKEGALFDYSLKLLGVDTLVDKLYEPNLSEDFKKVVSGYTEGLNAFAASHPKEVLRKKSFPFKEEDIIKGYTLSLSLMSGVGLALKTIKANRVEEYNKINDEGKGSNAIAIAPSRTEDGKTWLAINSHQPLEGRFAWYEAHINSEEGWNMIGGLFPGGISIFVGSSPNLGWAHTTNFNIWGDIHKLKQNPKNKMQYEYDGKWTDFKKSKAKLKVKVAGLKLSVNKRILNTEFGPVFETKHGWYALRFPAYKEMRAAEQWFRMNKAHNWQEFENAIKMEAIPSFNIIYGDKEGNILYQSSGQYPDRNPKLDWSQPITSASSKHKWTSLLPYEKKPSSFNPECGFVFNANNSPFQCSGDGCSWNTYFPGVQTFGSNRGTRLAELMDTHKGTFSWNDFLRIKYDNAYSKSGQYVQNFAAVYALDPTKYPDIADYIIKLKKWDLTGNSNSNEAGLAMVFHKALTKKEDIPFAFLMIRDVKVSEQDAVEAIRKAKRFLIKTHGTIDIKLADVQHLTRGDVSLPINGMSEVLRAAETKLTDKRKGVYSIVHGDGYIQFSKWGKDGSVELNSINAYGASARPESKHYTDQMELFVQEKTKPMTFDKAQILRDAKSVYKPE